MLFDDQDAESVAADERLARTIRRLSYAGFVPVLALTAWLAAIAEDHPWRAMSIALLVTYAALVLTFVAGARWGFAAARRAEARGRDVLIALGLAVAAWATLVLPVPGAFILLAIAFAVQGAWDAFAVHAGAMPEWYGRLRTRMTFLIVAAMIAALVATN